MKPESDILIRPATADDALMLCEFNRGLALESEGREPDAELLRRGVREALARPELARYFVAELDGRVVGQAMITYEWSDWRAGAFWWLQSVYVHPQHRGRGVFRRLSMYITEMARSTPGVCGLRLYVEQHNHRALRVYRDMGLTPSGHVVYEQDWSGLAPIQAAASH